MYRPLILALAAISLLLASCAKEPLKEAGLLGEGAVNGIRDLTSAYERRDIEAFMDRIGPSYAGRDAFRSAVENVFGTYQTIRFAVQYRKMIVEAPYKAPLKVAFTWEGEWKTPGGRIVKDGARVTLVLDPGVFKLLAVEGKNPFLPTEHQRGMPQ